MTDDRCPCGCGAHTALDDLAGHEDRCPTGCEPGQVAVRVSNTYACGRSSGWVHLVGSPPPSVADDMLEDWLAEHVVTGDGHPCGAREHTRYEVEIVAAPDRPDLVGVFSEWEG